MSVAFNHYSIHHWLHNIDIIEIIYKLHADIRHDPSQYEHDHEIKK